MLAAVTGIAFAFLIVAETADAASSWNPTLLVNTESFQTIDAGDATTNIELRFGDGAASRLFYDITGARFIFSKPLVVQGNLTATGSLSVKKAISGATLRIDGGADVWGTLSATGSLKTKSGAIINADNDTNDAIIQFGNTTAPQTLKFMNTRQRFLFSKDVSVIGNLSGSSLRIDGNAAIWGNLSATGTIRTPGTVKAGTLSGGTLTIDNRTTTFGSTTLTWPNAQGSANTFLKNAGDGTLSWSSASVGSSSGDILSIHPQYPNAVYFASGSTSVGTLTYSSSGALDNYYRWTTTRSTLQDYWISVRVQVPKHFTHFETASGIQLRLRTNTLLPTDNNVTVRLIDTANASVPITNNVNLSGSYVNAWRTNSIRNVTAGTYTPGGYITLLMKLVAKTGGWIDVGFVNFNWSNSTP